jgi:hypothetical protein
MQRLLLALLLPLAAHAITRVGHVTAVSSSGGNGSQTITKAYAPTSGNAVVVGCTAWQNGTATPSAESISDGGTNTYGLIKSQYDGTRLTTYIHRALNVTGGSFTYTCSVTGVASVWWLNLFVIEYSGVALTSADDGTPESGTGTGSPILVSPGVTTTNAADVLVAVWNVGDNNGTITVTPQNSFATVDANLDANCCVIGGAMDRIVAATGTYVASTTRSPTGTAEFSIVELALKGAVTNHTRVSVTVQ